MTLKRLLLPLASLVAAPLAAQDAWNSYVANLGTQSHTEDRWVLALSKEALNSAQGLAWQRENPILHLLASGEFMLDVVPPDAGQALWKARGWKDGEAHWVLISPTGAQTEEGAGLPSSESTLDMLRHAGLTPKWERRAAFLKDHPEQGEARWDALQDALGLAVYRIVALQAQGTLLQPSGDPLLLGRPPMSFATASDPSGAVQAERALVDVADALEPILELPGWQDSPWLMLLGMQLREWEAAQYPRLGALLLRLYEGLLDRLEAFPDRNLLWVPIAEIGSVLGRDPLMAATHVAHQAGDAWPSAIYLRMTIEGLSNRQGWAAVLAFLDGLPLPDQEPGPTPERWRAFCGRRADVQLQRLHALIKLERWEEAQGALEEARRWTGSQWKTLSGVIRRALDGLAPDRRARFEAIASQPELKDLEPLPARATPRLMLLGNPSWAAQWGQLKRSGPLQAWDSDELRWEQPGSESAPILRQRYGWADEPRWALLLGDTPLAQATACPTPRELADRLQGASPGHLHRLAQLLQEAPRNLVARRERAEALLARKPKGDLESQAAEDARLSRAPLRFPDGWKPSPEIWQWAAQKVLPELELELRSWPSRPEAWRAWIQWAERHPSRPSALALVRSIPIWGSETQWSAWLPKEVHLTVAEELRQSGRFEDMRAWFQEAWDGVATRPASFVSGMDFGRSGRAARIKDIGDSIVSPLREALTALRRDREVVALDAAFEAMKGNGRAGSRRRGAP